MFWKILCCLLMGYGFGCCSTAYLVGKANKVDIRNYGSGNAGTTNALRTLGAKAGLITFLGDLFKAIIPMLLVRYLIFPDTEYTELLTLYTGFGVVLGHNYPFWLKFKGGKGIAATAGVMLAFDPWIAIPAVLIFGLSVGVTRYVSLGSLLISTLFPIWVAIIHSGNIHMLVVALIFMASAFYKHKSNIKRLMKGTENKIGQKVNIEK